MKLSRNVLVGSLATAGMVLGALAPALTAQAATTSGTVDPSTGKVSGTVDSETGKYKTSATDSLPDGGLAIAYDDGTTDTIGEASAQSNANVKVVDGLLVLDQVPDFGFGTAAMGSTVDLNNNKYNDQATDSENASAVKVIESRSGQPGFTLNASMSPFTDGSTAAGKAFTMTLNPVGLTNDEGANVANEGASLKTEEAPITASATAAPQTVIDLASGTYKAGSINATYSTPDSASLKLVDGTNGSTSSDAKDAAVKSYNSTITWTLAAKPTKTGTTTAPDAG